MKLNRKQKKTFLAVAQFLLPAARYLGMYIYLRDSGALTQEEIYSPALEERMKLLRRELERQRNCSGKQR